MLNRKYTLLGSYCVYRFVGYQHRKMEKELNIAIEELYSKFSKYPFKSAIEGCPCCVSASDKATLHSKQLRELEDEDISRYAFKAMTTWGNLDNFKHYLPRILELTAKRKLVVDTFVVLGKLEYGKWKNWDLTEQDSINKFLITWWKYDINNNRFFDSELLIEINKLIKNLPRLLINWNLDIGKQGFRNFVELIEYHYHDLTHKNRTFEEFTEEEVHIFKSWIKSNSSKLEEGFFIYEKDDKEFSERISNTLNMFERID